MHILWERFLWIYMGFLALNIVAVSIEVFTYSGFLEKHFFLPLNALAIPLLAIGLYLYIYPVNKYPSFFKRLLEINKFLLLPVTFVLILLFTFLEYSNYPNYVFSTFHIHYDALFFIFALSGLTFIFFLPKHAWKVYQKEILFFIPIILLVLACFIKLWPTNTFYELSREDHLFENVQFLFFFTASLLSLSKTIICARNKQYFYTTIFGLFFLLLFFISGEEISWGQRIIGIQSSTYLQIHNMQKETSIHNLNGIQQKQFLFYLLFSGLLSTSWVFVKTFSQKTKKIIDPLVPPWYTTTFFLPIFLFYFFIDILHFHFVEWQEFVELLLATGLFISLYLTTKK